MGSVVSILECAPSQIQVEILKSWERLADEGLDRTPMHSFLRPIAPHLRLSKVRSDLSNRRRNLLDSRASPIDLSRYLPSRYQFLSQFEGHFEAEIEQELRVEMVDLTKQSP